MRMSKYWIFRLSAAILPRVPMRIARPLAVVAGTLIWALAGAARRRTVRNLRHIAALREHPDRLPAAARGVFQSMALNYLDFFRGRYISDEEARAGWTIENEAEFDALMAEGRGLIIFSGHFGNFEYGSSRLGVLGHKLLTPAEHMQPEALFELFCRLREHHNMRIVPADSRDSLRELLDALKRGEIVIFIADRYVLGASAEVPFFGEPARLPTGPFALALRSGAPVMAVFSWRTGPGRQVGVFTRLDFEALRREAAAPRGAAGTAGTAVAAARVRTEQQTERAQRLFMDELERRIAAHPDQWVSASLPIWEDS
jgi:lauroyl/myristoyl acyltransferase